MTCDMAVGTDSMLTSQSILCRDEQQTSRLWAMAIQEAIVEQFTRAYAIRRQLKRHRRKVGLRP